jgi:hypothetical protein
MPPRAAARRRCPKGLVPRTLQAVVWPGDKRVFILNSRSLRNVRWPVFQPDTVAGPTWVCDSSIVTTSIPDLGTEQRTNCRLIAASKPDSVHRQATTEHDGVTTAIRNGPY